MIFIAVFVLTMGLIWLLIWPATRWGLVDHPATRKHHAHPIPVVGGLAMWAAFGTGALLICDVRVCGVMLLCMTVVTLIGFLDDLHDCRPALRLGMQFAVSFLLLVNPESRLSHLGNLFGPGDVETGWVAWLLTPVAVTGLVNAFNMIDGLDGLSGGLALVATGLLLVLCSNASVPMDGMAMLLGVLAAALAGFLVFNLRYPGHSKASVFMGDAGSNLLGFLLVWFLIRLSQAESAVLDPVTALWLVALPLMDTIAVMGRRWIRGQSPFAADRQHLHHLLMGLGLSDGRVVVLLLGLGLGLGGVGILLQWSGIPEYVRFYAYLAVFMLYCRVTSRMLQVQKNRAHTAFDRRATQEP